MLRTITKLPRQFFFVTHYIYIVLVGIAFLLAALLLSTDGLSAVDALLLVLLVTVAVVVQRRFRPTTSENLPTEAEVLHHQITRSDRPTLLAFESEYCPICMVQSPQLQQLEAANDSTLRVVRLSIQNELGMSMFKKFDGRMAPTYILLDKRGNVMMDWILTLPMNRVLFEAKQAAE